MEIDENVLDKLSDLSKISFDDDDEKQSLLGDLSRIISYVEKINELDTEDIVPTAHTLPLSNVYREDEAFPSMPGKDITGLAPKYKDNFIVVPRVV